MNDYAQNLAIGWVEVHTEFDFDDLPQDLQEIMLYTANQFREWLINHYTVISLDNVHFG